MKYCLTVDIEPARHYLHVKGRITHPTGSSFYLNENFTVLSASSHGNPITYHMNKELPHPPFDTVSRPITFAADDEIAFEYEGYIEEAIVDVNRIDADMVELAYYCGWYPKPWDMNEEFDFEVKLQLPSGYEIASNGRYNADEQSLSASRQSDIVLFACNTVKTFAYSADNVRCIFLCPPNMLAQMEQRAKNLLDANRLFTERYGSLGAGDEAVEIVSVLRPCDGWGYKRGNATFLSATWEQEKPQYAGDFHELAHGWWKIADVTTDDWINEGGAEFSAYTAAKAIYGDDYAERYIADCVESIAESDCKTSIVDTASQSEYRHLNHYTKTTFMYIQAEKVFGNARVFELLQKVFATYRHTRNATTAGFLTLCDDMKSFFERYLYAEDWSKLIDRL